ncbi:MAG: STAS domain-containing protein [Verrucomicrobiota bacterium]|nr:STAS domain-containing protein [Verrucomicrobiota bacterium]
MELDIQTKKGITIIKVDGKLDASSSSDLKIRFADLLKEKINYLINMQEVPFIDSTGLGSLVSCLKNAAGKDGDVKLCNLQKKPRMVFEITRAYRIFDIFDDEDTAVDSFFE